MILHPIHDDDVVCIIGGVIFKAHHGEIWKLEMRKILTLIFIAFIQSTCYAVEIPEHIPKEILPFVKNGYNIIEWISADLNGDGLDDYFVIEGKLEDKSESSAVGKQHPGIILLRKPDDSLKLLGAKCIAITCPTCAYGYSIEGISDIQQITSWIPNTNWAVALPAYLPAEIMGFAEKGHRIKAWASADLNGDGLNDYLIVEEKQKNSPDDPDIENKQRPILILVRQPDQTLKVIKRNDIAVRCSTCALGATIEGFEKITANQRTFSITNRDGGTAFENIFTYTFGYSRRDNTWQLIRAEEKYDAQSTSEESSVDIFTPPKDFGKIDFADFDPESYRGHGEGYQPPKKKKQH